MKADLQSLTQAATPGRDTSSANFTSDNFTFHSHSDAAGHRDYKLYVPPGLDQRPVPLVVMLHGCSQNPDDFAAGTAMNDVARAQGFIVLYPAQSQKANSQGCWNWFKHSHQERGRGEPAVLASMTQAVMARHAIDPGHVYVAGLSAGGAMAVILGDTYPDIYAAVGVHSGLATGVAKDLPAALAAMKNGGSGTRGTRGKASGVATIVFHGDADTTVHPGNGNHVIMASAGMASSVEEAQLQSAGGLATTRRVYRAPDDGRVVAEHWLVHGAPHAWSGGNPNGSFTDARGPDASTEMVRFFMANRRLAIR